MLYKKPAKIPTKAATIALITATITVPVYQMKIPVKRYTPYRDLLTPIKCYSCYLSILIMSSQFSGNPILSNTRFA